MTTYYRAIVALQQPPTSPTVSCQMKIPLPEDKMLLERMETTNAKKLKKLDTRLEEAEKTEDEGECETRDASCTGNLFNEARGQDAIVPWLCISH